MKYDPVQDNFSGFQRDIAPPDEGNNAFVSHVVNKKVDPNAVYNTDPFYGKYPTILLAMLLFMPLGLFLLWRYKHSNLPIAIILTIPAILWMIVVLYGIMEDVGMISAIINIIS